MANNPFRDSPPRYLRATVYLYHFTTAAERNATGAWWKREQRGPYAPILTLKDGRLAVADLPENRQELQGSPPRP